MIKSTFDASKICTKDFFSHLAVIELFRVFQVHPLTFNLFYGSEKDIRYKSSLVLIVLLFL